MLIWKQREVHYWTFSCIPNGKVVVFPFCLLPTHTKHCYMQPCTHKTCYFIKILWFFFTLCSSSLICCCTYCRTVARNGQKKQITKRHLTHYVLGHAESFFGVLYIRGVWVLQCMFALFSLINLCRNDLNGSIYLKNLAEKWHVFRFSSV